MNYSLQREETFVGIAHGILFGMAQTEWHQHERRVLDVLFLETYGKPDPKRKGQLMQARLKTSYLSEMTKLSPRRVNEALKSLVSRNVVKCFEEPSGARAGVYGFQKYYEQWAPPGRRKREFVGTPSADKVGTPSADKSRLSAPPPPIKSAPPPPINPVDGSGGRKFVGTPSADLSAPPPPINHEESLTSSSVEPPVEKEKGIYDRSIDMQRGSSTEVEGYPVACPYRTALQNLRIILNAKEEARLSEYQALEATYPQSVLVAKLQARVEQARAFGDFTRRTCWALLGAADDLVKSTGPAATDAGHSPAELEWDEA